MSVLDAILFDITLAEDVGAGLDKLNIVGKFCFNFIVNLQKFSLLRFAHSRLFRAFLVGCIFRAVEV